MWPKLDLSNATYQQSWSEKQKKVAEKSKEKAVIDISDPDTEDEGIDIDLLRRKVQMLEQKNHFLKEEVTDLTDKTDQMNRNLKMKTEEFFEMEGKLKGILDCKSYRFEIS